VVYLLCLIVFSIGIYGVLTQRNLIKIILSLAVTESAVNIFLVLLGYRVKGIAPIDDGTAANFAGAAVDPLPQAMVLTAIVIGLGVLALSMVIAIRLYHRYGTYDITKIRKLRG